MIQIFMESGYAVDGSMMHHADGRSVRVRILHRPQDGYRLSYDGEIIKEQLPLPEFIRRLTEIEYKNTALSSPMHDYSERSTREVLSAVRMGGPRLNDIADRLDKMYAGYIKSGKAVLMEHTHSINVNRVESESVGNKERSVTQSERLKKEYPMTPDEAFRVSDDEVYYYIS